MAAGDVAADGGGVANGAVVLVALGGEEEPPLELLGEGDALPCEEVAAFEV